MRSERISQGQALDLLPVWAAGPALTGGAIASFWIARWIPVSHYPDAGMLLSVSGVVLSLIGFGVTLWQLTRTVLTTVAVQKAVKDLKRSVGSLDIISEVRTAQAASEAAQKALDGSHWAGALEACDRVRVSLAKMASVPGGLLPHQAQEAMDFIASCLAASEALRVSAVSADIENELHPFGTKLRQIEVFLIGIEFGVKDAVRGG